MHTRNNPLDYNQPVLTIAELPEYIRRAEKLMSAAERLEEIERQVLVIDALAVESALAGFRSGQTPFIAVLEAHRVLYEDQRQHAELLFHILWHSALLDALGMERQTS